MRATVIVDNIGKENIKGEWGLCIFIEYNGNKILLDTGNSNLFIENMKKLGISLENIDFGVLSHAHCDHSAGMRKFFENNKKACFYLQESCAEDCYFKMGFLKKYIGIPKGVLKDYKERIHYISDRIEIKKGITLLPHSHLNREKGKSQYMYRMSSKGLVADDFSHEQSLVFETSKGLIVFNSCSHTGADSIINEVAEAFPNKKVHALIGGFHLSGRSKKYIRSMGLKIKNTGIEQIYTGHCTKEKGFKILKEELGEKVYQFKVGMEINF